MVEDWLLKWIDSLLWVIFRLGFYEFLWCKDVLVKVIIFEYIDVFKVFFEDDELGFVNGVFDWLVYELCGFEFEVWKVDG